MAEVIYVMYVMYVMYVVYVCTCRLELKVQSLRDWPQREAFPVDCSCYRPSSLRLLCSAVAPRLAATQCY
ncbi:MAG: hypothetical protein K2I37_05710 [Muribaculaceae bacterium]|nr:hypothetical protein [Muribaculaceae bacterium]